MSADLPAAEISHAMPGRTRLRISDRRGDAAFFASIASGLSALPGVHKVEVKPLTGSVLVQHWGALDMLSVAAKDAGLFAVGEPPPPEPEAETEVELDPKLLFALALGALSLWQMSREKFFPPALTLLWYATNLGGLWRNGPPPEGE